ncbi:MAG: YdeI/OmpD-associated family protein [Gordonia sp. (in: high G+C Gram-positive bacteria)]
MTTAKNSSDPIVFDAPVEAIGDRLIARLPAGASTALPSRGQVAVTGTLDGQSYRTVVEPDGRRGHFLSFAPDVVEQRALAEGATVHVELAPTKDWPEPAVPDDFETALDAAPDIDGLWRSITPMARWEWVRWIGATKNPATRAKRVDVAVDKMRNGKRRPCCFDLSSCTDPELAKNAKLIEPA